MPTEKVRVLKTSSRMSGEAFRRAWNTYAVMQRSEAAAREMAAHGEAVSPPVSSTPGGHGEHARADEQEARKIERPPRLPEVGEDLESVNNAEDSQRHIDQKDPVP